MKDTYRAGLFGEWIARWYLILRGFRILELRYITGRGTGRAEIDIIAQRGNLIVFTEVKNRASVASGLNAITFVQHRRLRRAAETYLRRRRWTGDARFDVIVVAGLRVSWIKNAV